MSKRPIFVATHPRACSTAFERVFMTRHDTLKCVHEPFGDAFYFGPERLSQRYEEDEQARVESGFSQSTFKTVFDRLEREASEGSFPMMDTSTIDIEKISPFRGSPPPMIVPYSWGFRFRYARWTQSYYSILSPRVIETDHMLTVLQGKRLFIKDIIHYLVPPNAKPASIAPSLLRIKRGVGTENGGGVVDPVSILAPSAGSDSVKRAPYPYDTPAEVDNPTVVPTALLSKFHFTFLIRDPHYSIPSYYRCTIPPLDEVTGFYEFYESESGYDEVRRVFEYLRKIQLVGPHDANGNGLANGNGTTNGSSNNDMNAISANKRAEICVIDADDLLDDPSGIIERYCKSVGLEYTPDMLKWDTEYDQTIAKEAFEKWKGFHEDAIHSSGLKARCHKKEPKSEAQFDKEWSEKYGEKGAKIIRSAVDRNMADYRYMKKFAMKA
ncbi:hypothetical protein FQN52_005968 [Onygenales sp. PD_12]|nr:hypothetical protein FQN52_005968 [Onygenales sp. PD_12]